MRKLAQHLIIGLLFLPAFTNAQQKELKVLFVGNSYTYGYNLPHIVSIISQDLRPMVDLYTSDGSHPNELGTMLSASVFVRVITGELPEILPTLYRIEDAEFCRRIANQVNK